MALHNLVNVLILLAGDEASSRHWSLGRELRDVIERTIPYGAAVPWDVPFMGAWLVRLASWLRERAAALVSAPTLPCSTGLQRRGQECPRDLFQPDVPLSSYHDMERAFVLVCKKGLFVSRRVQTYGGDAPAREMPEEPLLCDRSWREWDDAPQGDLWEPTDPRENCDLYVYKPSEACTVPLEQLVTIGGW